MPVHVHHPKDNRPYQLPPRFVVSGTSPADVGQDITGRVQGPNWGPVQAHQLLPAIPGHNNIWRLYFKIANPPPANTVITLHVNRASTGAQFAVVNNLRIHGNFAIGFDFPAGPGDRQLCSASFAPYGTFSNPDTGVDYAKLLVGNNTYQTDNAVFIDGNFWCAAFYDIADNNYDLQVKGNMTAVPTACPQNSLDIQAAYC